MKPVVEIDQDSGFCFGVVTAIRKAEEVLDREGRLYCLGDIVHNSAEVERLRRRGLVTITHEDMAGLHGVKVLLRANGEPPATYELARRNDIEIVDATCPVVLRLQSRVKQAYETDADRPQIVIYGKNGHAEVNGLVGQTRSEAIVAEDESGLEAVDFSRPIALYSQTTKSPEGLRHMVDEISRRKDEGVSFRYFDTICRQVAGRVEGLRRFAAAHDVVLFVSGVKSSNGRVLCGECREVNSRTYLISGPDAVEASWLQGASSIGVCGATSTPRWLMEQVRDRAQELAGG